jgi:hypothetical protein
MVMLFVHVLDRQAHFTIIKRQMAMDLGGFVTLRHQEKTTGVCTTSHAFSLRTRLWRREAHVYKAAAHSTRF